MKFVGLEQIQTQQKSEIVMAFASTALLQTISDIDSTPKGSALRSVSIRLTLIPSALQ